MPPGVIWGSNNDVLCHTRLVTWTPSTFQIVDMWYSRIWCSMSGRCSIRFLNFYFHPLSQIRVKNYVSFQSFVNCTPCACIFQGIANKWYTRMWLCRLCRCPIRFKKIYFTLRGKKWTICVIHNKICSNQIKKEIFLKLHFYNWQSLISIFSLEKDMTLHFNIF